MNRALPKIIDDLGRRLLISVVSCYRLILKPFLAPSCRFHPSCSEYALIAARRHTSIRACWLIAKRLFKCNPLMAGGYDPVPTPSHEQAGECSRCENHGNQHSNCVRP